MVVDEDTECIDILEVLGFSGILSSDLVHALMATENILDCVIHWVVE